MKTVEETRSLKEFYPDSEIRHRVHYAFAHRFLPHYVRQNPRAFFYYLYGDKPMEPTRFIQSRWSVMFEEAMGLAPKGRDEAKEGMLFRRVSDLSMSIHVSAEKPVVLVRMPRPERPAEARVVAVALLAAAADFKTWPVNAEARIFTIEAIDAPDLPDSDQTGVLCEWTTSEHRNFGVTINAEPQAILEIVARALKAPHARATAGFVPPKGGQPGRILFGG